MSVFVASFLLFAAASQEPAAASQEPPVFRAEIGLVRVEVSVTRKDVPLRGLAASDFELRDNGRTQQSHLVLEEEAPVDAALILDLSGSVRGPKLDALKDAARAFLDGLREREQAALLAVRAEVLLLEPFTSERRRLRQALDRAEPRGATALRDAVYTALRLRAPGPRRTAVVVFSDGIDNVSVLDSAEVVETAGRSEAIVYGVAVRQRGDKQQPFLRDVVRATGGRFFEAVGERDLRARFLDVLSDIRSRYVLSYAPEAGDAPGWHALEVKLKRANADVLARPGYWR